MTRPPYRKLILTALADANEAMTAAQLLATCIDLECPKNTKVTLSLMVNLGYVKNVGKQTCECCGAWACAYRITDDGRIHLQNMS